MGHEFKVAAYRATADEEDQKDPVQLDVVDDDGESYTLTANYPGDGQVMAFMATNASFSSGEERIAGAVNFFVSLLNQEDHSYVVNRLFDAKDSFGGKIIMAMISKCIEEWSGRPTKSPSGSTHSRKPGGRKSTPRTPALTSSGDQ